MEDAISCQLSCVLTEHTKQVPIMDGHAPIIVGYDLKTHLPGDKMAAISQTTCSDVFPWMKSFVYCKEFNPVF